MASDQHGPTYPGDLVVNRNGVAYRSISFGIETKDGLIDRPNEMVGTSLISSPGLLVASVRGQGTWKYIITASEIGWVPWMSCDLIQSLTEP